MSLFGAVVKTLVNVACLPVEAVVDTLAVLPEAGDEKPFHRVRDRLQTIKDDVEEGADD